MKRILLHTCCGCCATHCIEVLREAHEVTLFFSNSNIWPPEEYERRLDAARKVASMCGVALVEDAYDHEAWLECVRGFEGDPEGGRRCERCFAFNLLRAARYAADSGFDAFTTTLTVSPHKSSPAIFRIGEGAGPFLKVDFKKRGGFLRSVERSRAYGLYRQNYCGCEFSRNG